MHNTKEKIYLFSIRLWFSAVLLFVLVFHKIQRFSRDSRLERDTRSNVGVTKDNTANELTRLAIMLKGFH